MSFAHEFHQFVTTHPTEKRGDCFRFSGSNRKHYGMSNPTMRTFVKRFKVDHAELTYDDWLATLDGLFRGESIDEACLGGFMLGEYPKFRAKLALSKLDQWIGTLEGWREIDTTCQSNFSAKEVLIRWDEWHALLSDFVTRPSIEHRRASLVLLIKPIRQIADDRLIIPGLENIDILKHEEDKLITKAISWLLRTAIKHYDQKVYGYVETNREQLPSIAIREFDRKYQTGKK